jgi:hypothetical protein
MLPSTRHRPLAQQLHFLFIRKDHHKKIIMIICWQHLIAVSGDSPSQQVHFLFIQSTCRLSAVDFQLSEATVNYIYANMMLPSTRNHSPPQQAHFLLIRSSRTFFITAYSRSAVAAAAAVLQALIKAVNIAVAAAAAAWWGDADGICISFNLGGVGQHLQAVAFGINV